MIAGVGGRRSTRRVRPLPLLLIAATLWALVHTGRWAIGAGDGLTGEYFANSRWTAPPATSSVDTEQTTAQLDRSWRSSPPAAFSVRWVGYLSVGRSGTYSFQTTSDDGSRLFVDNRLVVDNGGVHGTLTQSGSTQLERGAHLIVLEYLQAGGLYAMDWSWSRDGTAFTKVPSWRLSQKRAGHRSALTARLLGWFWWAAPRRGDPCLLAVVGSHPAGASTLSVGSTRFRHTPAGLDQQPSPAPRLPRALRRAHGRRDVAARHESGGALAQ